MLKTLSFMSRGRPPLWLLYACCCAVAIGGYFLLPSTVWQNGGYVVSNLVGLAAVVVGTRRGRPGSRSAWRLLAIFPPSPRRATSSG